MEDFLKNLILESFHATLKAKENNFARLCKEELVGFNDEFYNENEILDLEDNTPNETLLKSILNVACMGKYNSWTLEKFHQRLIENGISDFSNSHELYEYLQQKGSSVFRFISPIMFTVSKTLFRKKSLIWMKCPTTGPIKCCTTKCSVHLLGITYFFKYNKLNSHFSIQEQIYAS